MRRGRSPGDDVGLRGPGGAREPITRSAHQGRPMTARLSPEFDWMYADVGRPTIPPERQLKASLLIGLFSVRSSASLRGVGPTCPLVLGHATDGASFDATVFVKNRLRLLEHQVGQQLFDEVVLAADRLSLLSDEHYHGGRHARGSDPQELQAARRRLPQMTATGATPRWTFMTARQRHAPGGGPSFGRARERRPGWCSWPMR